MDLLVVGCARLFKTPDGKVYTPVAYDYEFYKRYLNVFETVSVAGFCQEVPYEDVKGMILVSGENLSIVELPYPHGEWDYIRKRCAIVREVKRKTTNHDAVLLRVPETLSFLVMDAIRNKNIPWAVEVTSDPINLYTKKSCPSKYRWVYRCYYYLQLRRACRLAHGISYVTQFGLQKRYLTGPLGNDRFETYYTDTNILIDENIPPRDFPKDRPLRLTHVSVSISGFAKGHKEAVEALAEMVRAGMKVELTLVGGGELAPEIQKTIEAEGLHPYIRFTGRLTADKVMEELDRADVFFFPSYNEGLPRVVVEAMSRGLPVVATDIPAHHELVSAEYLVPVEDSHALYLAVQKLMSDSNRYEAESRRNLEKVKEYDIRVIEKKRNDFYQKLYDLALKMKK